ncbi:MAG: DKNYY domain-containing protein [Flavobacteriaceae bacterium]|nr:DKNYY domain-containing protein [Flavobacteriaceae bacterium]
MILPLTAFPEGLPTFGINAEIIEKMTVVNNELTDNYYKDRTGKPLNLKIGTRNGSPVFINPDNSEWLSQTFFRNENELFGFSHIIKGASVKMFFTKIKGRVDFTSFEPLGLNFAKDKNKFYYGPGGKVINETSLHLYSNDEYKQDAYKDSTEMDNTKELNLWKSKIAITEKAVYWDGQLLKEVEPTTLQRVCYNIYADKYNVYDYDLQKIKKIEGIDRNSFIYYNHLENNSLKSYATDKYKPMHCYTLNRKIDADFDFDYMRPLFEYYRGKISEDYWWYKLEKKLYNKR